MLLAMLHDTSGVVGVDRPAGSEDRVGLHAVALEHHLAAVLHDERERHAVRRAVGEQRLGDVRERCRRLPHRTATVPPTPAG